MSETENDDVSDVECPAQTCHEKLDLLDSEITEKESRLTALELLLSTIKSKNSFTSEEKGFIEMQYAEIKENLRSIKEYKTDHEHFISTTIQKCSHDLQEREAVLNNVFSNPALSKHYDLMQCFSEHHAHLKVTLEDMQ